MEKYFISVYSMRINNILFLSENEKTDKTCYNINLNRSYRPNMEADTTHRIKHLDLRKCFWQTEVGKSKKN